MENQNLPGDKFIQTLLCVALGGIGIDFIGRGEVEAGGTGGESLLAKSPQFRGRGIQSMEFIVVRSHDKRLAIDRTPGGVRVAPIQVHLKNVPPGFRGPFPSKEEDRALPGRSDVAPIAEQGDHHDQRNYAEDDVSDGGEVRCFRLSHAPSMAAIARFPGGDE